MPWSRTSADDKDRPRHKASKFETLENSVAGDDDRVAAMVQEGADLQQRFPLHHGDGRGGFVGAAGASERAADHDEGESYQHKQADAVGGVGEHL